MTDCCAHESPESGDARFDIMKVADGVYAAVAAPAYKVNCNTAIIESDDGVVIVDTHSKPSAARVIVDRLRELTPKPVRYVINTHFHWDHWHGNEVYPAAHPGAEIVSNDITREAMRRKGLKRIDDHRRQVPVEIAKLKADLAAAGTPAQLDFTHIIMGHGEVAGRDWLRTFRSYVHDMVEAVRHEVAAGATLDEVKQRVPTKLAPTYEKPFSKYGEYRPWRAGLLANIERTFAMVS